MGRRAANRILQRTLSVNPGRLDLRLQRQQVPSDPVSSLCAHAQAQVSPIVLSFTASFMPSTRYELARRVLALETAWRRSSAPAVVSAVSLFYHADGAFLCSLDLRNSDGMIILTWGGPKVPDASGTVPSLKAYVYLFTPMPTP